jgi:IclR family KDG regulon transcriptional repressor
MGLPKGTVQGIVRTLVEGEFLQQDRETRKYRLGYKLYELGTVLSETLEINQKAAGPVHRLAERTDLICRVAIWDRNAALITLDATPKYADSLAQQIGPRVVAYCSAIGRALLAYLEPTDLESYLDHTELVPFTAQTITQRDQLVRELDETRVRGYAVNNQEMAPGRVSIAAPVFQSGGRLAASISLTGSPDRVLGPDFEALLNDLRTTAAEVSRYMGYNHGAPQGSRTYHMRR